MITKKTLLILGVLYFGYTVTVISGLTLELFGNKEIVSLFLGAFFVLFTAFYLFLLLKTKKKSVRNNSGDTIEIFDNKLIITSKNGKKEILNNILENEILISSCDFTKIIICCDINKLVIDNCYNLTMIYSLFDVNILEISDCDNVSDLLGFQQTRKLFINYCPKIKIISEFYSLVRLEIIDSGIIHIPEINLKKLICVDCEYLLNIPRLSTLEYLDCDNCPLLFINKELRHLTGFKSKNIGINIKNYIKNFQRRYLFEKINFYINENFKDGLRVPEEVIETNILGYL